MDILEPRFMHFEAGFNVYIEQLGFLLLRISPVKDSQGSGESLIRQRGSPSIVPEGEHKGYGENHSAEERGTTEDHIDNWEGSATI